VPAIAAPVAIAAAPCSRLAAEPETSYIAFVLPSTFPEVKARRSVFA